MSKIYFKPRYEYVQIPLKNAKKLLAAIYKLSLNEHHDCDYFKTKYITERLQASSRCQRQAKYMIEIYRYKTKSKWYIAYLCPVHIRYFRK